MTAEIIRVDKTDPRESTLAHFGREVLMERKRHKVTQMALAQQAHCHYTLVQKIETAQRVPTLQFAEACDCMFKTDGRFTRMWPVVIKYALPAWFRPFVVLEEQATLVQSWELHVIPGLLQTEGYARATLSTGRLENVEDVLAGRMHRQHILLRDQRPRLWSIMEEAALRRVVGGRQIMREQLAKLVTAMEDPRTVIQILPADVTVHSALGGAFQTLSFEDGSSDVVYIEGFPEGRMTAELGHVDASMWAYDLLRAAALPPEKSMRRVAAISKELYV